MGKQEAVFVEIDIVGLAECLAEDRWKHITESEPENNLYQTVVNANGEVEKVVNDHWTREFFTLKEVYLMLISNFTKHESHGGKEEEGSGKLATDL
jgi:hypothetical protein